MKFRFRYSVVRFGPEKSPREEIQDELMKKFQDFPSVNINFSQLIRDNVEEAFPASKEPIPSSCSEATSKYWSTRVRRLSIS